MMTDDASPPHPHIPTPPEKQLHGSSPLPPLKRLEGRRLQASQPDADLGHRAGKGHPHSCVTPCEGQRARVWRIASSVAKGADAEDLAQEAVIRGFRAFSSYVGEAPFEAWLCRIAVNVAHDYRRSAWK